MRKFFIRQRQFFVFIVGGGVCALIDIGLMQLLIAFGINYVGATSTGFLAGLLINYAFHANLTFRANTTSRRFVRYLCVVVINYLITIASVSLSMSLTETPLIGKLVSLPIIAINGYMLSKYWIFK
ncbi:GtrA family protein [Solimicrobium silvestre]|uniref:GtrA-like protein n=1 Tax=Solimicrobium silvestre TaxID=2099400 RepID=A0A2S9H1V7_9BURK|nr:GtrA family protein [Solimicrobium silvestre]PRC93959.1 GtrA-like protein [Solimicrobium silvestre]